MRQESGIVNKAAVPGEKKGESASGLRRSERVLFAQVWRAVFGMRTLKDCTAVVCYNDELAIKILGILQENGIAVPRDIELVSFDNSTLAQLSAVRFLSMTNPKEQLGQLAAKKLLNILQKNEESPTVLPWGLE